MELLCNVFIGTLLQELLNDVATVLPAVNQCEYHPHWTQPELVEYCARKGIHFQVSAILLNNIITFCTFSSSFQAYSSFGSESNRRDLFDDEKVQAMAAKYACSVTDFLLGWALSQGMVPIKELTSIHN